MVTTYFACVILVLYIVVAESFGRVPGKARQFRISGKWQIHTFLYVAGVILGLVLAPLLNLTRIGYLDNNKFIGWIGIVVLLIGLSIRAVAIFTLGKFHTRSLMVLPNQQLIRTGVYKYVRHPGYLGTIIGGIGFALATTNWITIVYMAVFFSVGI